MKTVRKIVAIDEAKCDGCGLCANACAEGAIAVEGGKARLVTDSYCDGLGACLGECPRDAIRIIERQADAFDESAVEHHLTGKQAGQQKQQPADSPLVLETLPCGCPSTRIETFSQPCQVSDSIPSPGPTPSALQHWPVQIRLVPPTAPFLKGAHLLVAADCTPLAYPDFHRTLLKGKAVMLGCPKFDETNEYIAKFKDIFRVADIKSVTVAIMEVPCCSKLPVIVREGMRQAGRAVPFEVVVIGTRGDILRRQQLAA
jgi:Pyruvate/2-oxoacid:ferredoxin oxidoreductase delta subunit